MISVDLVNVYQSQGLHDRALDILQKYLEVHPENQEFLQKKQELEYISKNKTPKPLQQTIEDLPDDVPRLVKKLEDLPNEEPQQFANTTKQLAERKMMRLNKFLVATKKRAESRN